MRCDERGKMRPAWLHYWEWQVSFEPRDIWVGVFWKRFPKALEFYLCVLPMIPLRVYVQWH